MSANGTRQFSSRYAHEIHRMRGTATTPSDLVNRHSRKSFRTGTRYDFIRIQWGDGAVTVRVNLHNTTTVLHEWTSEVPVSRPERPESLPLAVYFEGRGWKTFDVTGTRHAYYLIRKLAADPKFGQARLKEPLHDTDGTFVIDNVLVFTGQDVSGLSAKYTGLLDRSNTHYDLKRSN